MRSIGVSNYNSSQLAQLLAIPGMRISPAVNQIRYHAYNTLAQAPVVKLARKHGVLTAAYSALTPLTTETGGPVDDVLRGIVEGEEWTAAQVLLDWVKGQGLAVVTCVLPCPFRTRWRLILVLGF